MDKVNLLKGSSGLLVAKLTLISLFSLELRNLTFVRITKI